MHEYHTGLSRYVLGGNGPWELGFRQGSGGVGDRGAESAAVELFGTEAADLSVHAVLRVEHHLADVGPGPVVQPLEEGDVEVLELGERLDGCSELHVVAHQDGFGAAFDEGDEGHRFGLLGRLVDDDGAEFFVAEEAEAGADAGREH